MAIYNTIKLHVSSEAKILEMKGSGVITPGDLLEHDTGPVIKSHYNEGGTAAPLFAIENTFEGKGIGDDYADGETIHYVHCLRGDVVWAWLTTTQTVAYGYYLTSSAVNGKLKIAGATDYVVGYAMEDVTTVAEPARIKIAVL